MSLTDEQIAKMMQKEIKAKTILVDLNQADDLISECLNDGWELVNKIIINSKAKITFRKVK